MKRILSFLCVLMLLLSITGCVEWNVQYEFEQPSNEQNSLLEMSNDDEYTSRIMTNNKNGIAFELNGDAVNVSGTFRSDSQEYLRIAFDQELADEYAMRLENNFFNGTFILPEKEQMSIDLYAGETE